LSNEADVRQAIGTLVRADIGSGGVVTLLGKLAAPTTAIVQWGDAGMNNRPVVTMFFPVVRGEDRSGEVDENLLVDCQFDVHVERDSGRTGEDVIHRLKEILTNVAFDGEGLDVAPWWGVGGAAPMMREGASEHTQEVQFRFNR